jgi:hypothetical protein
MVANGNVTKRVSNETSSSFSLTKKMKRDLKKLVVLNIDDL